MPERYYCPELTGSIAVLDGSEAHHAVHVMRIQPGQQVQLFDGYGTSAAGTVKEIGRRQVRLEIGDRTRHARASNGLLTVAAAAPKGDRLKWMIEKLTEVGVDRFIPLLTERSIVNPGTKKIDKLAATVVSAAKQSGRVWLMEIASPLSLPAVLEQATAASQTVLMAHPGAQSVMPSAGGNNTVILIGPEGGFTEDEVRLSVDQGASLVSRQGAVLRTETAAVAFAVKAVPWTPARESD